MKRRSVPSRQPRQRGHRGTPPALRAARTFLLAPTLAAALCAPAMAADSDAQTMGDDTAEPTPALRAPLRLTESAAAPQAARLRIYGRAGTFGTLPQVGATPSGDAVVVSPIPGWGFLPGQSAYFPVVAPDGTVVIANEPQTDNQLRPTSRQMAVSTFDPVRGTFANVIIPTSTGKTTLGGPWASAAGGVGGGDISDIGIVRSGGESLVTFTSAMPFWGWSAARGGEFPTIGVLREARDGVWLPDPRRSLTASMLAATPPRATGARRSPVQRRAAASACVQRDYPATGRFGDCHMPAEFEQLPESGALVMTQYAIDEPGRRSGRISTIVGSRITASYAYPSITLADGTPLTVHPREVVADPLGHGNDERFVVIFDAERTSSRGVPVATAGAIQEFRYDDAAGTITPTSAPVLTGDLVGGRQLGAETARYGSDGSLWVGQSIVGTLGAGPLAVYARDRQGSGVLADRPGCAAGAAWNGASWGQRCAPDSRIAEAAPLGIARSIDEDPQSGAMLLTTMSGVVLPITRANGAAFAGRPINLGLDQLVDRTLLHVGPRKAAFDAARGSLWIPVQQLATNRTCTAWPCLPTTLDQWLVEVDVRGLLASNEPSRADH